MTVKELTLKKARGSGETVTDKQFNYILSRLKRDILDSLRNRTFQIKDCDIDDLMVVSADDLCHTINLYFDELKEGENLK